ncbi:MAG: AAA family ATPase [Rubrivivax sp.]|nr:AAA family ATPase [Rubrivivax sp.]
MITRIEATRYRCFDKLDVELGDFRVLVGANGSGKTTLLDIPVLLGDLLRVRTIDEAFMSVRDGRAPRAASLSELLFQGQGENFILGVEAKLPEHMTRDLGGDMVESAARTHLRYELRLQVFNKTELQVQNEYLFAFPEGHAPARAGADLTAPRLHAESQQTRPVRQPRGKHGLVKRQPPSLPPPWRLILSREYGDDAEYIGEKQRKGARSSVKLAPSQLALARVQFENQSDFPAARWFFDLLVEDAVFFDPDWNSLRMASPPGLPKTKVLGSAKNAPWLALELQRTDPERFALWKTHVRLALPQVSDISVHEREDDHHAYFRVRYGDRYDVPSSGLSDGTLRILVLTLLAYIAKPPRFLVTEEPENGIHPQATEVVLQSLSSIYDSQVIVSSHSPVVLASMNLEQILAARISESGAAQVVAGTQHPRLVDWKGEVSLPTLFATGVLG